MKTWIPGIALLAASYAGAAASAEPAPEPFGRGACYCQITNLTRCDGAGPSLLNQRLYADPERRSQWFFAALAYDPHECATYDRLGYFGPAFNYYGYVVRGCALMSTGCAFVR